MTTREKEKEKSRGGEIPRPSSGPLSVERATDPASQAYWDSLETLGAEVREMPEWMKTGTPAEKSSPPLREVTALIGKWREEARTTPSDRTANTLEDCASELEATLGDTRTTSMRDGSDTPSANGVATASTNQKD